MATTFKEGYPLPWRRGLYKPDRKVLYNVGGTVAEYRLNTASSYKSVNFEDELSRGIWVLAASGGGGGAIIAPGTIPTQAAIWDIVGNQWVGSTSLFGESISGLYSGTASQAIVGFDVAGASFDDGSGDVLLAAITQDQTTSERVAILRYSDGTDLSYVAVTDSNEVILSSGDGVDSSNALFDSTKVELYAHGLSNSSFMRLESNGDSAWGAQDPIGLNLGVSFSISTGLLAIESTNNASPSDLQRIWIEENQMKFYGTDGVFNSSVLQAAGSYDINVANGTIESSLSFSPITFEGVVTDGTAYISGVTLDQNVSSIFFSATPTSGAYSGVFASDGSLELRCFAGVIPSGQSVFLSQLHIQMPGLSLLNFTDDLAASTGGVPQWGLYRNGSVVQICQV